MSVGEGSDAPCTLSDFIFFSLFSAFTFLCSSLLASSDDAATTAASAVVAAAGAGGDGATDTSTAAASTVTATFVATAAAFPGGGGYACILLEGFAMCPLSMRRIISRPEERWVGRGAGEEEEEEEEGEVATAAGVGEEKEGDGRCSALSSVRGHLFLSSLFSRFRSFCLDVG